jgi:shikimate kinase
MLLSLIGMSGSGKSFWSKKLEQNSFEVWNCDHKIEEELEPELQKLGYKGLKDMSKWLGQPFEERYHKNSRIYLYLEQKITDSILEKIEKGLFKEKRLVIDTTGSLIYLKPQTLQKLKDLTEVIYLKVPSDYLKKMQDQYFLDPKPVIWGDIFNLKNDENPQEKLKELYPKLLEFRQQKYQELAKKTFDAKELRENKININQFLQKITNL